jgi:chorismate mutase
MTDHDDGDTDLDEPGVRPKADPDPEPEPEPEPAGPGAAYEARTEGMSLAELREEIRDIDREIVELIARRTYVADTIAGVKAERGLPTTDERQEEQVMERAGENARRFEVDDNLVKAIFRLLIELNKVEQRENR